MVPLLFPRIIFQTKNILGVLLLEQNVNLIHSSCYSFFNFKSYHFYFLFYLLYFSVITQGLSSKQITCLSGTLSWRKPKFRYFSLSFSFQIELKFRIWIMFWANFTWIIRNFCLGFMNILYVFLYVTNILKS